MEKLKPKISKKSQKVLSSSAGGNACAWKCSGEYLLGDAIQVRAAASYSPAEVWCVYCAGI